MPDTAENPSTEPTTTPPPDQAPQVLETTSPPADEAAAAAAAVPEPQPEPEEGALAAEADAQAAEGDAAALPSEQADAEPVPAAEGAAVVAPAELSPAACAALLAQHFPALFGTGRAMPIKLRIQADIQARAPGLFSKKSLSLFLHRHTTSTAYLKALVASPQRFDLDGAEAGEVATEHREAAVAEVERRRAIVDARRQAERDAQRQAQRARAPVAVAAAAPATGEAAAAPPAPAPAQDRPPRPVFKPNDPRAKAARREGRPPAGPRQGAPHPDRPNRPDRPPRPDQPRAPRQEGPRPPRQDGPRQPRAEMRPAPQRNEEPPAPPGLSPAELEARRERALLLRAWEGSTLTRANFCVLKRISEADLEAALNQAQQERGPRPQGVRPQR